MTVHGVRYGLDEVASIQAQFGGIVRAIIEHAAPTRLERIDIVEIDSDRVDRLRQAIEGSYRGDEIALGWLGPQEQRIGEEQQPSAPAKVIESAGATSEVQRHVFVAMPFKKEMEDVFYYGIEHPVHAAGFLCERIDLAHFYGGIAETIRSRIESAELVIADLTGANPNVYLEVGYAWGKERDTILLVKEVTELKFDVAHMRCIVYESIRDLEMKLTKELAMYAKKRIAGQSAKGVDAGR